ncbi:MAG: flavodoxin domain-containing protein, partial [Bacteroidales bacterium]
YYATIVGKYGSPVQKILQKLSSYDFNYICSLHGPVWKKHISDAVNIYDRLSRYEGEEGVVVAYGSMYGNTEEMAEAIAASLTENGVKKVIMHNLSKSDISEVIADVFKYKGLVIGSPTYCNELFPEVKALTDKIQTREIKNRTFAYFGSYTWAGAAVKHLAAFAEKMQWEVVNPSSVEMKQGMKEDTLIKCYELGKTMAERLKQS